MIRLTRLNGHPVVLNADLIRCVEQSPDTVITLTAGDKLLVTETPEAVVAAVRAWRQSLCTR